MGLGQPAVLLDGVADPHAKPASRSKPVEGLGGLEAGAERVCPRILERDEPGHSVRLEQGDGDKRQREGSRDQDQVPQPAATCPVGADEDADHDDRGAQVRLQQKENEHAGQHRRERDEDLVEVAHTLRVAIDPVRHEHRERELAELGRLKCTERPGVEPPPRAVDAHAQVRHEDQEHEQPGRDRSGRRQPADPPVVDPAEDEKRDDADQQPRRLTFRVVEGRLVLVVGERDARARDHDQARPTQGDGREEKQPVGLRPRRRRRAHAANRCRTSSLNWLPRSSKSLNMS